MKSREKIYLVELSQSHLTLMNESDLHLAVKKNQAGKSFRIYIDEMNSWVDSTQLKLMPSEKREWYYLQDQKAIGVFNELEIIRLVQSKKIQPTQFVWKPGMQVWTQFCRTAEFSAQNLRHLVNEFPPLLESVFSKRQSRRISYHADFLVHDQDKIWKAQSFEIGAGGIGLQVRGQGLTVGQSVNLHLLSVGSLKSLNARAEIVSHLKDSKGVKPDRFGLKFIEIKSADQQNLLQLVSPNSNQG